MAGSLKGPIAKLARAESQCRILQSEIHVGWPPGNAWPVEAEVDRAGLEYRFYLRDLPTVNPEWALLASEILFNLRSSLDHLVWELHVRRWRGRVPTKVKWPGQKKAIDVAGVTQFPIYRTTGGWQANRYRIDTLSERERRAMSFLQPYETRRDGWRDVRHGLEMLNTLHNIDKHRQLHVIATAHHAALMMGDHYAPELGFRQIPHWGVLKPDGHVETWTFAKVPPQVQPHHGALLEVHLQAGYEDWSSAAPLLGSLWSSVALVIRRFKGRFPPVTLPADSALSHPGWWGSPDPRMRHGPYLVGIP